MKLVKAIEAAAAYSAAAELGVQMVSARSMDMTDRWFRVEGVRRAFRRVYVVDMQSGAGYVVEVLGGSHMDEADLITYAMQQRKAEEL
jgi:hypothetical protein